jgi:hypothetical protein
MSVHKVEAYVDEAGEHRWRVVVKGTPGSAVPDNIVADCGEGYNNKREMCSAFFGMIFGDWDDSFLALYNEWHPEAANPQEHEVAEEVEPPPDEGPFDFGDEPRSSVESS